MDSSSTPVNWETLDALVIEFAKSENLIEDSSPVSSPSSSSASSSSLSSVSSSTYQSRLLIRQIRRLIVLGDIDSAIDLLRVHAPFILDDHRLLFLLHKQKFIELLRKGTTEDRAAAMSCLRTGLAPCALDAYPEAYEEFKHVLLAFIYDKNDKTSPVADEWSEKKRFDIAGLMSSVLRAQLHAYDPVFSMAVRYLISIHKGFCLRQGISSPISDLTERLLLEERDPAAKPQESLYEAPPFDEVDVQALAHAVELTRQGAVDSLRFAKGDLVQAFQNELCRMKLDVTVLDDLVHEYCIYRGIVDSSYAYGISSDIECGSIKQGAEISGDISQLAFSIEADADMICPQTIDTEDRYPYETTSNHEDCSTSGTNQTGMSKVLQRNRGKGIAKRNKRKRWRGRQEDIEITPEVISGGCKQDFSTVMAPSSPYTSKLKQEKSFALDSASNLESRYEIVLRLKELASKGMAAEVVEEINVIDPNFFAQNSLLLFQLKQLEFLKLVRTGDHSSALKIASTTLGPLGARDPTLLKPLKETLMTLLRPNEMISGDDSALYAIATSLQVAIGRRLGIEEPRLMKILRTTLHTHNEWFKLQMCKDVFEGLLRIDSLKDISSTSLLADSASKAIADTCARDSSQVTVSSSMTKEDSNSPAQVSSKDVLCEESAIIKVMEFLALPRADAIHLLVQYNGNAETVIQQIFS
ncbi:hypothetical protein DCAR_0312381 [Daucus carota subsp. sativus]|uniref:CTLH domain-containing protein n=1 Tax=Daucus carota subsp. sativus TaxID=79200 RepID=A0AAF0WS47_DAUCS|nr:hypothetical protein DCAR_0312381 [Daucus carota subsp. sativus]